MNDLNFDFTNMNLETLEEATRFVTQEVVKNDDNDDKCTIDTVLDELTSGDESESSEINYDSEQEIENIVKEVQNSTSEEEIINGYGCKHYLRRCKIVSPCCNKLFTCRKCHDEEMDDEPTPIKERHRIDRFMIEKIICNNCNKEQSVQQYCIECKACFGFYFCKICNFFDDIDKKQYHCEKCGFCRIGGSQNNFHCDTCNQCLNINSKDNHKCLDIKESNCPICMDSLFDSTIPLILLKCGHRIHKNCFMELLENSSYKCPMCSKSMIDLTNYNYYLDKDIAYNEMPEEFKNKKVDILCHECEQKSNVDFHFLGHKCINCGSYNTRQL